MIIEALIAVTFLAALVVFVAPDEYAGRLAAALSALPILGSLWMWAQYDASGNALLGGSIAFETDVVWLTLGGLDLHWFVGVDGISLPLVVLTTILSTLAIVSAWTPITERQSQFYGLMLFMEANLLGVFTALDFFAWFVFWEAVLVPMYFLIGVWRSEPPLRRDQILRVHERRVARDVHRLYRPRVRPRRLGVVDAPARDRTGAPRR
jgi:NADH-quinone oxidoreductase subunit M